MRSIFRSLITSFAVLTCAAGSVEANAQSPVFDNPDNRPFIGARIGLDVTLPGRFNIDNINSVNSYNSGAGFSFGAVYNRPLLANLYLEPGFLFYYDTTGEDVIVDVTDTPNIADVSLREFGFRIPVVVGYHFDFSNFSLRVYTGPELKYGLHGKIHYKLEEGKVTHTYSEGLYEDMRRWAFNWQLGAGLTTGPFDLTLTWAKNASNITKMKHANWHCSRFTLGLGYNF